MAASSRREYVVVAAFVLAAGACQWGSAWHVDEPFFLAIARQILRDPNRPLDFFFNWYGRSVPMSQLNNTPPLLPYALAAALKLTGGSEFWTRAFFFPLDVAAAWGLLALAGRFLRRPIWPTLLVLAGPGWALTTPHVMAERLMLAFAMPSLYWGVRWAQEGDEFAMFLSAALAALALLTKYNALFLLMPVLVYARAQRVPWKRLTTWTGLALSGLVVYQAFAWRQSFAAAATVAAASNGVWASPAHKARSLLAFVGGLGLFVPAAAFLLRPRRTATVIAALLCAALFGPWFDLAPLVEPVDRFLGFLFAFGLSVAVSSLIAGRRTRGAIFWSSWAASAALLQTAYWSVLARFAVLVAAPLTFWMWERLEEDARAPVNVAAAASFAFVAALSLALGFVDRSYAEAQKSAARESARGLAPGAKLWCAGHWGLQEYMTAEGARQLDADRGGWDAVRPGDRVVVSRVNTNVLLPRRPLKASTTTFRVESSVPLRLISGWKGEGGFYSNVGGFLPWSVSTEPVDEITFVDAL